MGRQGPRSGNLREDDMFVRDILGDQRAIISCRPEDTVQTGAMLLHSNYIGAMPVLDAEGKLVGIFGERDIVRAFASRMPKVAEMRISELMSKNVITCSVDASVYDAMALMKKHRIRHLPVMDGQKLIGVVSIRDALELMRRDADLKAAVMRDIAIARAH